MKPRARAPSTKRTRSAVQAAGVDAGDALVHAVEHSIRKYAPCLVPSKRSPVRRSKNSRRRKQALGNAAMPSEIAGCAPSPKPRHRTLKSLLQPGGGNDKTHCHAICVATVCTPARWQSARQLE